MEKEQTYNDDSTRFDHKLLYNKICDDGESISDIQYVCAPEISAEAGHISKLPMEVIIHILKHVVLPDLDLRSLESFSNVCRGFYMASASSELWRPICLKAWGINSYEHLDNLTKDDLKNCGNEWRCLFLKNPRVHFNGCYVANISYIREGERGFQDHELYKAWHEVSYYRILNFRPGGKVIMATTVDNLNKVIHIMENALSTDVPGSMIGTYRIVRDRVVCDVKTKTMTSNRKNNTVQNLGTNYEANTVFEFPQQVFHFELKIKEDTEFNKLEWQQYTILSQYKSVDGTRKIDFDISDVKKYPPFKFATEYNKNTTELLPCES